MSVIAARIFGCGRTFPAMRFTLCVVHIKNRARAETFDTVMQNKHDNMHVYTVYRSHFFTMTHLSHWRECKVAG